MNKMSRILVVTSLAMSLGACVAVEESENTILDPEKGVIQGVKNEPEAEPEAEPEVEPEVGDALAGADAGVIRPAAGVFDVGVVPSTGSGCPAGSNEIRIRMDDEDGGNGNAKAGWIGQTRSDGQDNNTLFVFCEVDGDRFRPLSGADNASDPSDDYAVLKLGTTCPTGSQEFWRRFDNEDDGNRNYKIGVIDPNTSDRYGTKLFFCLFRYASAGVAPMASFPDFSGFHYGVFAPDDFNRALALGSIRTDDEDDGNRNDFYAPPDALTAAKRVVEPDTQVSHGATFLRFAQVR